MEPLIIIVGLALLAGVIYLSWSIHSLKKQPQESTEQKLFLEIIENLRKSLQESDHHQRKELQERFDTILQHLNQHQDRSLSTLQKQFNESSKIIQEVTKKLTQLDETNKQVVNFAEQMRSLENILKNPKQRGILGEYFLETLLANILAPDHYTMQYSFEDGQKVDAVIYFRDKIIPIDAKFSLEKYNALMEETDKQRREQLEKEFKLHIKTRIDETAKYIKPRENTTDFAFMFIPAEGVYYNLLIYGVGTVEVNTQDLVEYAFKKHVIIVSPTSFFAYLETVLQGLKALKMEESVKEIGKRVEELSRHLNSYETFFRKVGTNLGTTVNMYNQALREFEKIDKDVHRITEGKSKLQLDELTALEKPSVLENVLPQ